MTLINWLSLVFAALVGAGLGMGMKIERFLHYSRRAVLVMAVTPLLGILVAWLLHPYLPGTGMMIGVAGVAGYLFAAVLAPLAEQWFPPEDGGENVEVRPVRRVGYVVQNFPHAFSGVDLGPGKNIRLGNYRCPECKAKGQWIIAPGESFRKQWAVPVTDGEVQMTCVSGVIKCDYCGGIQMVNRVERRHSTRGDI